MAGSDDRGLDLRLPWGRSSPPGRPSSDRAAKADPERPAPRREARQEPPREQRPEPRREGPAAPRPPSPRSRRDGGDRGGRPEPEGRVPVAPGARPARVGGDAALAGLEEDDRTTDVDDAVILAATPGLGDRLERLELGILPWFSRLEEQASAYEAALEARIEKLETRLTAAHDASVEAVGLLAGQLVARIEQQIEGIEAAMDARHQRLVTHVEALLTEHRTELLHTLEADRGATVGALDGLASAQLVERLLDGVVALGEVLDAELVTLRQLITHDHAATAGAGATPPDEPTQPELAVDRHRLEDEPPP